MNNWEKYLLVYQGYIRNIKIGRSQFLYFFSESGQTPLDFLEKLNTELDAHPLVLTAETSTEKFTPYFPFLDWIKSGLQGRSEEDINGILKAAEVYPLHEKIFMDYFLEKETQRPEPVIIMEQPYESRMMYRCIWSLLQRVFEDQEVIFILDQIQDLTPSTWQLLTFFWQEGLDGRFAFLMNQQKHFSGHTEEKQHHWQIFQSTFEDAKTSFFPEMPSYSSKHFLRRYSLKEIEPSIKAAGALCDFFNLFEARELIQRLHSLYVHNPESFTIKQVFKLYLLLGNVNLMEGRPSDALIHWGNLLSILQEGQDKNLISWASERMAMAFNLKKDPVQGQAMAEKAISLGEETENEERQFWGYFALIYSQESLRNLPFDLWRKRYRKYLAIGQELGFQNALSYWLTNPYYMDNTQHIEEATYYQEWGMRIAEKNLNLYRLADSYQQRGYFWSVKGEWDKVEESYYRAEELKQAIGHSEELPFVYNGLGFFQLGIGRYQEAQGNFIRALEGLKKLKNFSEICLTLYNMGFNAFHSYNFNEALYYFNTLTKVMKGAGIEDLIYHSKFQLLAVTGISHFKMANTTRAYEVFLQLSQMNHTPRGEEILSFYLLSAYIRHMEKDFEAVKKNLTTGEDFLVKNRLQFKLFLPHYYLEMGELLADVGENEKARGAWKKGYMESFQTPNEFLREKFQNHLRPEERKQDPVVLLRPPVDFDWIVDSAKMEKAYLDLHREMGARELLWSFQKLSIQYRDTETLINKTMRLFQRGYMLDGVYFLWDKGNGWEEAYSNQYMNPKMMEEFYSKVEDFRRLEQSVIIADPQAHHLTKSMNLKLFSVISIPSEFFQEMKVQLICTLGRNMRFRQKDLELLELITTSLTNLLGRLLRENLLSEKNYSLLKAVTKDQLTGLNNRQALMERVLDERRRLERYKKHEETTFSVIFFDIDHLKTYNMSYGQKLGDKILLEFSGILQQFTRSVDFISRFSADEFVLVLPETGLKGTKVLLGRILDHMANRPILFKPEEVPKGMPYKLTGLTFSAGVAVYTEDMTDPLKAADLALREAKKSDPGTVIYGNENQKFH
jgi:diguanylate cyclase (GGDEF)-like protein